MVPVTTLVHTSEPHDVTITRPSMWGNPFYIGVHGSRAQVVQRYEHVMRWRLEKFGIVWRVALLELRGKRLACCCKERPCHGEVLLKLIQEVELLYT